MYKWKPSRSQKRDFAIKMEEINDFCSKNGIIASSSNDSYYFTVNDQKYRVSNHTIESSNAHAYNCYGEQIREKYHDDKRDSDVFYIHASKLRIIEIYSNLKDGIELDHKGYPKCLKCS